MSAPISSANSGQLIAADLDCLVAEAERLSWVSRTAVMWVETRVAEQMGVKMEAKMEAIGERYCSKR